MPLDLGGILSGEREAGVEGKAGDSEGLNIIHGWCMMKDEKHAWTGSAMRKRMVRRWMGKWEMGD